MNAVGRRDMASRASRARETSTTGRVLKVGRAVYAEMKATVYIYA